MSTVEETPVITLYVVYDHPRDYPDEFDVRRWHMDRPELGEPFARGASLEAVRAALPRNLWNLGRHKNDDEAVVEVWI